MKTEKEVADRVDKYVTSFVQPGYWTEYSRGYLSALLWVLDRVKE